MKSILIFTILLLVGCNQTKDDLVASKCRLKAPVQKEQCEAVGVKRTKGGQLEGLPVTRGDYVKFQ